MMPSFISLDDCRFSRLPPMLSICHFISFYAITLFFRRRFHYYADAATLMLATYRHTATMSLFISLMLSDYCCFSLLSLIGAPLR